MDVEGAGRGASQQNGCAAVFVECDLCDHGRTATAAEPYVEMFVQGRLPGLGN